MTLWDLRPAMVVRTDRRAGILPVCACLMACTVSETSIPEPGYLASDPLEAIYDVGNERFYGVGGEDHGPAAPGSAARNQTSVVGEMAGGDLDGNGGDDLVFWLVHQTGGSGSFYYLAAALKQPGGYQGTRAIFLGDRILPQGLAIKNGVVIAGYADRHIGEPMAYPPTLSRSAYFVLEDSGLAAVGSANPGEQVLQGWFTYGHEVRRFQPCTEQTDLWVMGASTALSDLLQAHRSALPMARPYMPVFVTIAGRLVDAPAQGFGADYAKALVATSLIKVWPHGNCKSDRIIVHSPRAGAAVESPLTVRGRARGSWFFEGDFPLLLKDGDGNLLAQGYASARGEWMIRGFVPFEGILVFEKPAGVTAGVLVLKKDNPTGYARFDDALRIQVGLH